MIEKMDDIMKDLEISSEDVIRYMLNSTDKEGILNLPVGFYQGPGWEHAVGYSDEKDYASCRVDWDEKKCEDFIEEYRELYGALQKIATYVSAQNELDADNNWEEKLNLARKEMTEPKLIGIWEKYIQALDVGKVDYGLLEDIIERMALEVQVKCIARRILAGESLDQYDKVALREWEHVEITEKEKDYYDLYWHEVYEAAKERLGEGFCAYDVWYYARRLTILMGIQAPDLVLRAEEMELVVAMLLHKFGISKKVVENPESLKWRNWLENSVKI